MTAGPQRGVKRHKPMQLSERQFQQSVIEWATTYGWQVHGERPGLYADGRWATMVQGQAGYPDLVLCRPPRLIFAELKVAKNKPTPLQNAWLELLALIPGVEVYVWRPEQWSQILVTLSK